MRVMNIWGWDGGRSIGYPVEVDAVVNMNTYIYILIYIYIYIILYIYYTILDCGFKYFLFSTLPT